MKLIIAIVSSDDVADVTNKLIVENFRVTKLTTSGGFLKAGNTTLLIGTDEVDKALEIIKDNCQRRKELVPTGVMNELTGFLSVPLEVTVGGATVFVLDVDQFKTF